MGLAFQLVDDSLDFIGTKATLGKRTLSDLAQGIAAAPVLFSLEEHPQIYDLVNRKFKKSRDVDQASEMVQNSQGILKTQQLAAHHAHQAALAIAGLPPSLSERALLCRRALTEMTEMSLPNQSEFNFVGMKWPFLKHSFVGATSLNKDQIMSCSVEMSMTA